MIDKISKILIYTLIGVVVLTAAMLVLSLLSTFVSGFVFGSIGIVINAIILIAEVVALVYLSKMMKLNVNDLKDIESVSDKLEGVLKDLINNIIGIGSNNYKNNLKLLIEKLKNIAVTIKDVTTKVVTNINNINVEDYNMNSIIEEIKLLKTEPQESDSEEVKAAILEKNNKIDNIINKLNESNSKLSQSLTSIKGTSEEINKIVGVSDELNFIAGKVEERTEDLKNALEGKEVRSADEKD